MARWSGLICWFTLVAVLFGTAVAVPYLDGTSADAGNWTLTTPCCPENLPEESERSGTSCACPCDMEAIRADTTFPPAAPAAWLTGTPMVRPPSLGYAPQQPVPIA